MPDIIYPDLPLDDEREDHIDHGQPTVEPGDPSVEQREPPCGSEPIEPMSDA